MPKGCVVWSILTHNSSNVSFCCMMNGQVDDYDSLGLRLAIPGPRAWQYFKQKAIVSGENVWFLYCFEYYPKTWSRAYLAVSTLNWQDGKMVMVSVYGRTASGRSVASVPDGWFPVCRQWGGGHWQWLTHTKFRTFASEKYFVNRSSLGGEIVDISPKLYKTLTKVLNLFTVSILHFHHVDGTKALNLLFNIVSPKSRAY